MSLSEDDRAAIESASDRYIGAMNASDWAQVTQSFSEDAVRVPPHEAPHRGRAAIKSWLGGVEELHSYELTRDRVDGSGEVAFIRGRYAITLRPVGAPEPISDEGDFLEIWQRDRRGAWQIAEAMWNTRLPRA